MTREPAGDDDRDTIVEWRLVAIAALLSAALLIGYFIWINDQSFRNSQPVPKQNLGLYVESDIEIWNDSHVSLGDLNVAMTVGRDPAKAIDSPGIGGNDARPLLSMEFDAINPSNHGFLCLIELSLPGGTTPVSVTPGWSSILTPGTDPSSSIGTIDDIYRNIPGRGELDLVANFRINGRVFAYDMSDGSSYFSVASQVLPDRLGIMAGWRNFFGGRPHGSIDVAHIQSSVEVFLDNADFQSVSAPSLNSQSINDTIWSAPTSLLSGNGFIAASHGIGSSDVTAWAGVAAGIIVGFLLLMPTLISRSIRSRRNRTTSRAEKETVKGHRNSPDSVDNPDDHITVMPVSKDRPDGT